MRESEERRREKNRDGGNGEEAEKSIKTLGLCLGKKFGCVD